jgi:hypothetical protein
VSGDTGITGSGCPSLQGLQRVNDVRYGVYDNLGEFDQKGSVRTK